MVVPSTKKWKRKIIERGGDDVKPQPPQAMMMAYACRAERIFCVLGGRNDEWDILARSARNRSHSRLMFFDVRESIIFWGWLFRVKLVRFTRTRKSQKKKKNSYIHTRSLGKYISLYYLITYRTSRSNSFWFKTLKCSKWTKSSKGCPTNRYPQI